MVVGSPLTVRSWGLRFLLCVHSDEQTLALIRRVLALGGSALVAVVLLMTWTFTLACEACAYRGSHCIAPGRRAPTERMLVSAAMTMATPCTHSTWLVRFNARSIAWRTFPAFKGALCPMSPTSYVTLAHHHSGLRRSTRVKGGFEPAVARSGWSLLPCNRSLCSAPDLLEILY